VANAQTQAMPAATPQRGQRGKIIFQYLLI
jgi:hypothetical protein